MMGVAVPEAQQPSLDDVSHLLRDEAPLLLINLCNDPRGESMKHNRILLL